MQGGILATNNTYNWRMPSSLAHERVQLTLSMFMIRWCVYIPGKTYYAFQRQTFVLPHIQPPVFSCSPPRFLVYAVRPPLSLFLK